MVLQLTITSEKSSLASTLFFVYKYSAERKTQASFQVFGSQNRKPTQTGSSLSIGFIQLGLDTKTCLVLQVR